MRILHLGDLHIGKKVNDFQMLEEQKYVFEQIYSLIKEKDISTILISGDVFDRAVPSSEALEAFGEFLSKLNELKTSVLIIPGNHDNTERIAYLSDILKGLKIYTAKNYEGKIEKVALNDEIDVYLMPYLYPALIRKYYSDFEISNYNEAMKKVVDDIEIDKNKFNILMAHQFVSGSNGAILSESEKNLSVGTIDVISSEIFKKFDYTALGHLHCPQEAGNENVRYCGSILKYSFSEINQKKVFTILNIENKKLTLEFEDIKMLHEMSEYKGYFSEFTDEKFYSKVNREDYIRFILYDDNVADAKLKLSGIYPNIMVLEFDNAFTKSLNAKFESDISHGKSMYEHFEDFYKLQTDLELNENQKEIIQQAISNAEGN